MEIEIPRMDHYISTGMFEEAIEWFIKNYMERYGQTDVPMISKRPVNMACQVYQTIKIFLCIRPNGLKIQFVESN